MPTQVEPVLGRRPSVGGSSLLVAPHELMGARGSRDAAGSGAPATGPARGQADRPPQRVFERRVQRLWRRVSREFGDGRGGLPARGCASWSASGCG